MGENDPIKVANNPNIEIKIDQDDLSVGTARYTAAKQISKNLAMLPNGKGRPPSPIAHANVEVHLRDSQGKEVPPTRRLVRYWYIKPMPGAVVSDTGKWQIVGLKDPDAPLPTAPGQPAAWNFEWDRPSKKDAPGVQGISVKDKSFGQLQEFLVGNAKVGGAYYQVYILEDQTGVRVVTSNPVTLSAEDYRTVLKLIDSGEYTRLKKHELLQKNPSPGTDSTTLYPTPNDPIPVAPSR